MMVEERVNKLERELARAKRRERCLVVGVMALACLVVFVLAWKFWPVRAAKDSAAAKDSVAVKDSAVETVRAYLTADTWRGRLPYVLDPERVRPFMEAHYSKGWKQYDFQILTQDEPKAVEGHWVEVQAVIGRGKVASIYHLKKTEAGYRIDWESSAGFNPTSVAEFHATRSTTPVRFRAWAKLDSFYNFEFAGNQDTFWSITIMDSAGETIGYGYAMKNAPVGDQLFKALRDGAEHRVVLDLVYLPDARSSSCFVISNVHGLDSWREDDQVKNP